MISNGTELNWSVLLGITSAAPVDLKWPIRSPTRIVLVVRLRHLTGFGSTYLHCYSRVAAVLRASKRIKMYVNLSHAWFIWVGPMQVARGVTVGDGGRRHLAQRSLDVLSSAEGTLR